MARQTEKMMTGVEEEGFVRLRSPSLSPVLKMLEKLHEAPPQTILLEGGSHAQRLDVAKYWAALANCGEALSSADGVPCLACKICRQIAANQFSDLHIFDGRISNTEDEENPGPVKALNMRRVRELKTLLATEPNGAGKRVVIMQGLPINRDNAANALLKALEEPSKSTLFVLLAPQRDQLLPTLVSRSFTLVLPWGDPLADASFPGNEELAEFFASGKNFLDKISLKGYLDYEMAHQIILDCQKSLMRVLSGNGQTSLDHAFAKAADAKTAANISHWLVEARQMLQYMVNPARVLEGLLTRLFCILH